MSVPTEFDFAIIKLGNGASPEVFAAICGLQDAQINQTAATTDRYVRDCAKPGEIPKRKVKVNGLALNVTGAGLSNADTVQDLIDALGKAANYKIEGYADDGTDAGELLGTFAGAFVMTASNLNVPREGAASGEVTLASHGAWTWTAAS